MAHYGSRSKDNRSQLHPNLQKIFDIGIKRLNFIIICGYRPLHEQFKLYKLGRALIKGKWKIIDKTKIVTNCDGYKKLSNHNYLPSLAGDIIPDYKSLPHIDWSIKAIPDYAFIMGYFQRIADEEEIKIKCGCKWDKNSIRDNKFKDYGHIELVCG